MEIELGIIIFLQALILLERLSARHSKKIRLPKAPPLHPDALRKK